MTNQSMKNNRLDDELAPLPEGPHQEMRTALQRVLHDDGISQAKLGREVGLSSTVINLFMNGRYNGDVDGVARTLRQWMETRNDRAATTPRQITRPSFVETRTATDFSTLLTQAQMLGKYVVLCGAPGIGKTLTAQRYINARPNTWLVTMTSVTATPAQMLGEIEMEFGLSHKRGTTAMRRIGEFVRDKRGLLIIDEAQHLETKALDQLRSINDLYGCGIAVLGNEGLLTPLPVTVRRPSSRS